MTHRPEQFGSWRVDRLMPDLPHSTSQSALAERLTCAVAAQGELSSADLRALQRVKAHVRLLKAGEDIVRQGDRPDVAVFVLSGMLARYHTLAHGDRQFLSFHIERDMPDLQSLFLGVMDHSLCAMDDARIALLPHKDLCELFRKRPSIAFTFWRITLVDAAIMRQAITNNSAREAVARLAHFFCEQHYRAQNAGLLHDEQCALPLSQDQIGQALGMSLVSVNRGLQELRREDLVRFRAGKLHVLKWTALSSIAAFDPSYLHILE